MTQLRISFLILTSGIVFLPSPVLAKKPPKLELAAASPYFSPNKDGVYDAIVVSKEGLVAGYRHASVYEDVADEELQKLDAGAELKPGLDFKTPPYVAAASEENQFPIYEQ